MNLKDMIPKKTWPETLTLIWDRAYGGYLATASPNYGEKIEVVRTEDFKAMVDLAKSNDDQCGVLQSEITELKEANANCISLSLHEYRMKAVEQERDQLKVEIDRIQEKFQRESPRLYTLRQELRYLRDIEQNFGKLAVENQNLKSVLKALVNKIKHLDGPTCPWANELTKAKAMMEGET